MIEEQFIGLPGALPFLIVHNDLHGLFTPFIVEASLGLSRGHADGVLHFPRQLVYSWYFVLLRRASLREIGPRRKKMNRIHGASTCPAQEASLSRLSAAAQYVTSS